jgi:hypothetical protein
MPIIRKKLVEDEVYPSTLRYNTDTDTVQSLVNGDWVDNPDADPRHQTTLPPRITSDSKCDAAQSIVDALQGQLAQVVDAIGAASTLFTIAGLILGLFTFGTFDIFISIALTLGGAMVDAGAPTLESALSPAAFETLKCILRCQMDSNGRLTSGSLAIAEGQVTDQIGGLGALVMNAMLSLAGEGGLNNLSSLGTSTGDCTECDPCSDPCGVKFVNLYYGTFLGVFDGYYRYASQSNGTYEVVDLGTASSSDCCSILDYRDVSGSIERRGRVDCGSGSITFNWSLGACVHEIFADNPSGGAPFVVEILFDSC